MPGAVRVSFVAILAVFTFTTGSAYGQLTATDIAALQQQGQRDGWTFTVGENDATRYSLDQLCSMKEPPDWRENATFDPMTDVADRHLPSAFNWLDVGLPPVRNQGGCGSCWAFGTVGPLECNIKIQDGLEVDLSEQFLLSCNRSGWGCDGGWFAHDYHWWVEDPCDSTGAVLEADFEYEAYELPCGCPYEHRYKLNSWAYIGEQNSTPTIFAMKQAILEYGPISVCVRADAAMQSYNGGIFNACDPGDINHAVTIVGWDDDQGTQGVWIMRNSWGNGWGENGYMRILYGCSRIGYAACYVDYAGGASFEVDTVAGWVPFDVNFSATSGLEVETWNWDFGDGTTDSGQVVGHQYNVPGTHSVCLEVTTADDSASCTRANLIMALADTLVPVDQEGLPDSTVEVIVRARNNAPIDMITIPIYYAGDLNVTLDSFSTAGCRTEYFEAQSYIHDDGFGKKKTVKLVSSNFGTSPSLPVGEGAVLKLYFHIPLSATNGQSAAIDISGYSSYAPMFKWPRLDWTPVTPVGTLSLAVAHGDMDGSQGITVADLTHLVSYLFSGGPPPVPPEAGDVDCADGVNVGDVTYLVNYLFGGGPPPPMC